MKSEPMHCQYSLKTKGMCASLINITTRSDVEAKSNLTQGKLSAELTSGYFRSN